LVDIVGYFYTTPNKLKSSLRLYLPKYPQIWDYVVIQGRPCYVEEPFVFIVSQRPGFFSKGLSSVKLTKNCCWIECLFNYLTNSVYAQGIENTKHSQQLRKPIVI